jgi:enoyl-CoA hydratase/carnithine racemase
MSDLLIDRHGPVTVLTLNRPERMNAMGNAQWSGLRSAVEEFNADPDQLVAVITGAGGKAFSAGGDLKEMADNAGSGRRLPISGGPDLAGVLSSEKPVIAAINGICVSGGLELALCCDIRFASTAAWFGLFEVKRGILAGVALSALPRLMPYGAAMDLLLSADRMSAADAYRLGLVQYLLQPEELMDAAMRKAEAIAENSPTAVWGSKKILSYWRNLQIAEHQAYYEAVAHRVLLSGDVLEGPRAFAEKRPANFRRGWRTVHDPE